MPTFLGIEDGSIKSKDSTKTKGSGVFILDAEFSITYLVMTDNLSEDLYDVYQTPGIPALYASGIAYTRCCDRQGDVREQVHNPTTGQLAELYAVTCTFKSDVPEESDQQNQEPDQQRPHIRWSAEMIEERVEFTVDTPVKPVVTFNNEPMFFTETYPCPLLSITRHELGDFDPSIILAYVNTVNSGTFYGAPAGFAMMKSIESDEEIIGGPRYTQVTYNILFNPKKIWQKTILHEGYLYRKTAGGAILTYTEGLGRNARVNLKVSDGTRVTTPEYITFNTKKSQNFNALYLGPY